MSGDAVSDAASPDPTALGAPPPISPAPAERLARLAAHGEVDVLILGGGVNGAGTFRDLCAQGVRCLLVDVQDLGAGTSAAPSRLIHGGLKYLETAELGLVAQSTLERNLLLVNAPHCVAPLPTLIPIFSWLRGVGAALRTLAGSTTAPRARGAALIKLGLTMYDAYGARERTMPRHRMLGRRAALASLPALTPSIVAAGLYHDAWIRSPERLVLELACDGLRACEGAAVSTHTRLVDAVDGTLSFRPATGDPFAVRPKLVINAAGPWIDRVNAALGAPGRLVGGTRGSHLLLDNDELVRQLDGRMIYFEADDGRICLVFDYLGRALVGSTDIPADDPDEVRCTPEERDYLLASVRALLPGIEIEPEQVVHAYSGIRPLPASDATVPGMISRDHSAPLREPEPGRPFPILSLVGGKWTTFRGFAEEVTDTVLERLGGRAPHEHARAGDRRRRGIPDRPGRPRGLARPARRGLRAGALQARRAARALRHHGGAGGAARRPRRRAALAGLERVEPRRDRPDRARGARRRPRRRRASAHDARGHGILDRS